MSLNERQKQLGDFLRHLRASMAPEEVGFGSYRRRRTPGLRREEVAEIIGVGPDWYARLEQGRDAQPSEAVIDRLGQAFHLSVDQRAYLSRLARSQSQFSEDVAISAPARLVEMIDSMQYQPAYVRNVRWDILARNPAHTKVFGSYPSTAAEKPNMLWLIFTDPHFRAANVNWEVVAQKVIAKFRSDWSRNPEDKQSLQLIEELKAQSPEFSEWWSRYDIEETLTHPIELRHAIGGRITLDRVTLHPEGKLRLSLIVYVPVDVESERNIRALCK